MKIKRSFITQLIAFGLIFSIARVATDEPSAIPFKPADTGAPLNYNLSGDQAVIPERLSGIKMDGQFKRGQKHLITYERASRHFAQAGRSKLREVTAYNVGDPEQNWGDPCQSANGENICAALDSGLRRCAANFVPFGTLLRIAHYGTCKVTDRMHKRYADRVDIAMKKDEKKKALRFGLKRLPVTILGTRDG